MPLRHPALRRCCKALQGLTALLLVSAHRAAVTAVVSELGVSEANLRHLLFERNGLPERLLLNLQDLTGLEIVSKQQIEDTHKLEHPFVSIVTS